MPDDDRKVSLSDSESHDDAVGVGKIPSPPTSDATCPRRAELEHRFARLIAPLQFGQVSAVCDRKKNAQLSTVSDNQEKEQLSAVGDNQDADADDTSPNYYEVEDVVKHRRHFDGTDYYLTKWKGFSVSEATWEPIVNFSDDTVKCFSVRFAELAAERDEKDSSAVGDNKNAKRETDSSGVGDKNATASPLDLSGLDWIGDVRVFALGSKLWRVLEVRCRDSWSPELYLFNEDIFCDMGFYYYNQEARVTRYYFFWLNYMKTFLKDERECPLDLQLLKKVPPRPVPKSQRQGQLTLTGTVRYQMEGLLTKYNWQVRRPFPQHWNVNQLDTWQKVATNRLDTDQMDAASDKRYRIATPELYGTSVWHHGDVDWKAMGKTCSSLLVPTRPVSAASSAVGDVSFHYVREDVLGICFNALCWLLRHHHTAVEIEAAWQTMPIVRPGRPNRSDPAPGQKRKAA